MAKNEVEDGFLNEYEGAGLDHITSAEKAIAYLSLVQPGSAAVADNDATPGVWRNSASGEEYGDVVNVVVLDFKTIWSERDNKPPYGTIARYEPKSIEVSLQRQAGSSYPKMFNPKSGLEIQELYVYAVMLPEHPDAGILFMSLPVGSMRACRSWNTQLTNQLLSNGAKAPIFAYTWDLAAGLVDNPNQKNTKVAKFMKAQRGVLINKEMFEQAVKPQLPTISQTVLAITMDTEQAAE